VSAQIARLFAWSDVVRATASVWLTGRSPRERALMCAMTLAAAGMTVYEGAWRPLTAARATAAEEVARTERAIAAVRALEVQGASRGASTPAADSATGSRWGAEPGSAPARVAAETAAELGLVIRRLSPEGGRVAVAIENAPFSTLIEWIEVLQVEHAIAVASAEIERRPEPGVVSAQIVLER
jgi:general secretion pathway protein M